ncbi:MAG TPA: SRPBCC domain-containing protein [Thermoanaerobaculia bacterium]
MSGEDHPALLIVRRVVAIPREEVFEAWLDPASLGQWMRPGDVRRATAEVDPRVGGKFRIVMHHGGRDDAHWGEYLAIEPPSRLSFTWISEHTNRQPTVVTIEFLEKDGGTEVVLTHRRLPPERRDAHRGGWGAILEKLEKTLAGAG